jgi:hypothetical protein
VSRPVDETAHLVNAKACAARPGAEKAAPAVVAPGFRVDRLEDPENRVELREGAASSATDRPDRCAEMLTCLRLQ